MNHADLLALLQARSGEPDGRVMFHGTGKTFSDFSEAHIGGGADANSALGVHFAEWPGDAAEYAEASVLHGRGPAATVLAVWVPARNPTAELDYLAFFGYDENGDSVRTHADFARLRQDLRQRGHDAVDYEDSEQVITVALAPEDLIVVARLTPEQAGRLHDAMVSWDDPVDPARQLEEMLALTAPEQGVLAPASPRKPRP